MTPSWLWQAEPDSTQAYNKPLLDCCSPLFFKEKEKKPKTSQAFDLFKPKLRKSNTIHYDVLLSNTFVDVFQHAQKQPYQGGRISICIDQALNKTLSIF